MVLPASFLVWTPISKNSPFAFPVPRSLLCSQPLPGAPPFSPVPSPFPSFLSLLFLLAADSVYRDLDFVGAVSLFLLWIKQLKLVKNSTVKIASLSSVSEGLPHTPVVSWLLYSSDNHSALPALACLPAQTRGADQHLYCCHSCSQHRAFNYGAHIRYAWRNRQSDLHCAGKFKNKKFFNQVSSGC